MKKHVLFIVVIFTIVVTSCKKEEITVAPSVEPKDKDVPPEIFGDGIPYVVNTIYITDADVKNAEYVDNFTTTYRQYDQYDGHLVLISNFSQDWYTIRVPKFWGTYEGQSYISESLDVYSISAQALARVREMIKKRGGDCIATFYLDENEPTGTRQSVGWVLPN